MKKKKKEIIGNNKKIIRNNKEIPEWKINWIRNNDYIKNIYEVDNIYENKVNLKRIKFNVNCKLCERNHERDNAFCIVHENNIMFYCNRNKKGKSIRSWYTLDKKCKKINPNINELEKLKKENIELKEKIISLEDEIKILKKISSYIPNKNTTLKKCNKINLLEKYYEAGKLLINNEIESFKKIIIQHWKDKNISKIKNRCLRIYNLLSFMKNNNIENIKYSLRNIFNLPNWDFDHHLKNKLFF
jgi:hypothetical protein